MSIALHITGLDGMSDATQATSDRLHNILSRVNQCGKQIADGLLWTTRAHFERIYPGSKHYDPNKVQETTIHNGSEPYGEIEIDVPGIARAYHDVTIRPRFRKWLTIPMRGEAFGKKADDFDNLFVKRKKDGRAYLAERQNGHLVYMFRLVKEAFQKRDSKLMPSDQTFTKNIVGRIHAYLSMVQ